ncbi:alpha/beta fold hydrolase [Polymorphobacter fuscus]|uniref:Alpha/beta fold hydrolase n=1 Tax=Sandarakinorhabdus fusca TaxID=1439888 RepID=A0A7C9KY12_9SPHN|nr:alpha/beta hydrolase [Polymorphobacter fuscus]KAB7646464.1 alpha/beta hydrolase [Polymorphobacter fuscus]MQT17706.1 alpha/beta fold hydrolase [Polymorphobacter fuscus]NJC09747.1 pimeloyl-ACP methyl ester carboxylesterase [Polymorphobacter fuscus]
METRYTPSRVRLRRRTERPGRLNWLFLPGGPGLGSESLHELIDALDVPGSCWAVDLPGDGSNHVEAGDPFAAWPQVLLEAADALPNPIFAGHSTGGMYLLSTPALERRLAGLVLLSTAPDANWRSHYEATVASEPLPAFDAALHAYSAQPTTEHLRALCVASAEWNFNKAGLEMGRNLLARMPYNREAVEWSDTNFDSAYVANWWPARLPTMILAGSDDRIVGQSGWDDARFKGPHVRRVAIAGAGHFPWIENPGAVRRAFADLAEAALAYTAD